ncbi:MAG TPA: hypothetical protein ENK32_10430 [Anaerolineae bacterium]|nr:hypothetical protein [Anaerolineae bacterium]
MNHKRHSLKINPRYGWIAALFFLMGLAMTPYGWVAAWWPGLGFVVDALFSAEWAHVAGHMGIFALLATAVLTLFPRLQKHPALFLTIFAFLALLQEGLQLVTFKHRPIVADDLFDLAVDMVAVTAVYLIVRYSQKKKRRTL